MSRLQPGNAAAWGAMGLITAQLNRRTEALDYWRRALRLDPNYFAQRPDERTLYDRLAAVEGEDR